MQKIDGHWQIELGTVARMFPGKTSAPTVDDDSGAGYIVGDVWLDEVHGKIYQSVDVTIGAASWIETSGGGGGGAVDSVNGQTGDVSLDQDDILDGATNKQFSGTEKTKLAGIQAGAEVNAVDSVNGQTGDVVLDTDDLSDTTSDHKFETLTRLLFLDSWMGVIYSDLSDPSSPSKVAGRRYIISGSLSGEFAGHASHLAYWDGTTWSYYVPKTGDVMYKQSTGYFYMYGGVGWTLRTFYPMAHASSHILGSDPIGVVSASSDGLMLSLPNDATKFFNGAGAYVVPDFIPSNGWIAESHTWTFSSADSPTFVASVNADMTGVLWAGKKIKLTQTTDKYFFVTAVGSFSGGATLVTLYGGTDYTLANATITSPYHSITKAPAGFPLDPSKWTVTFTDTTQRSQANAAQNTWYNLGSLAFAFPLGAWRARLSLLAEAQDASAATGTMMVTLSTGNNNESNSKMTEVTYVTATGATGAAIMASLDMKDIIVLASKTTHYVNARTTNTNTPTLYFLNNTRSLNLTLECAYL